MPIKIHKRGNNYYYQYGKTGHKYYFNPTSQISIDIAFNKALKQQAAIHISQYYSKKK